MIKTHCRSLLDLNRAGVPLMEIVFEPDLSTGEEAAALLKELSLMLLHLDTCSCEMHLGALRCDANISIHKKGEPLGTRTEIKNIASIRGVARAIDYEIQRQIQLLKNGGKVLNETRNWDVDTGTTIVMRDKEVQQVGWMCEMIVPITQWTSSDKDFSSRLQDYRFMPEPNLPSLVIDTHSVEQLKNNLPEMPNDIREQLKKYDLPVVTIETLVVIGDIGR